MRTLNRSVAIVKPKRPFIKWANMVSKDREYALKYYMEDCLVILIPRYYGKEAKVYVEALWEDIFEDQLFRYCHDKLLWPSGRTEKLFKQWFEIEYHSRVAESGLAL